MLLNIPRMVLLNVLSQWCACEDVMKVDSAFMNKMKRSELQKTYRLEGFVIDQACSYAQINFISMKRIKVREIECKAITSWNLSERNCFENLNVSKLYSVIFSKLCCDEVVDHLFLSKIDWSQAIALQKLSVDHCSPSLWKFILAIKPQILSQLTEINWIETNIDAQGIKTFKEHIAKLSCNVTRLKLANNEYHWSLEALQLWLTPSNRLRHFTLENPSCRNACNKIVECIHQQCTKLESLTLICKQAHCNFSHTKPHVVTEECVQELVSKCPNLTKVFIKCGNTVCANIGTTE